MIFNFLNIHVLIFCCFYFCSIYNIIAFSLIVFLTNEKRFGAPPETSPRITGWEPLSYTI